MIRLTKISFILFILISLYGCPDPKIELYGSIEGIVTDAVTEEPINGALVTISPISTSMNTGSDGRYHFTNLDPSLFTVQIEKNGYLTNKKIITVEPGETRNGDVQLFPEDPILNTSLSSLDYGSNLTSLPVEISNKGGGELEWNVSENVNWISVNPLHGTVTNETNNIIISVDRTGLTNGNYQQNISITSNGGEEVIIITLSVL